MVDGVFARAFKSNVRPIELGRRMLREMDENRSVDVRGRRIVPNCFTFWLSPTDHAAFAEVEETLVTELCEAARQYAREENYHFLGPVTAELTVENTLKPGRFQVTSQLKEAPKVAKPGHLVLPSGERIALGNRPVLIGRTPECAVVVSDLNVSRHHAEIRPLGNGFVIADLGSTNGTAVNGVRITGEQVLRDGDVISLGTARFRYEAS
jgi:hypothetical protein